MSMYKSVVDVGGVSKVLVAISHKDEGDAQVVESTTVNVLHHVHILDRSGSMYSSINTLIDNVQKTIDAIGEEDLLTVIWFASDGQHRTLIKGAKKFEKLNVILDSIRSTLGCTCFSSPLKELNTILDEIGDVAPVSVTLFTDGCPVTPWSSAEEESRCMTELNKMKDRILAFNTVGYGNYYNQSLLKAFSATSEFGTMIHSSKLDDYLTIFNHNFEKVSEAVCESISVDSHANIDIVYLNRTFTKMDTTEFKLSRIDKRKNQIFLLDSEDFDFMYNSVLHSTCDTNLTKFISKVPEASLLNFYYAYAYNLYYAGRRLESLDVLAKNIGDKALVDSHLRSFTYDECATHAAHLEQCVYHNNYRYSEGKCDPTYLPADDAKCVLDILNDLQTTDSYYIPFSKNIKGYDRIGRKAEDSFNLFEKSEEEVRTPFSDFVYNKTKMNLSIRFYINGTVALNPKEAKGLGIDSVVKSGMFRNHTIIKDSNLNMKQIEAIIPLEKVDLSYMEIIETLPLEKGSVGDYTPTRVVIDFSQFPIINRSYINDSKNIDTIFDVVRATTRFEAEQKIVGYFIDQVASSDVLKKTGVLKEYTVDQIQLLENHGLDKNLNYKGVDVKKASAEESDSYQTRELDFYFSGFSTFGKVQEMLDRVASNKKLTANLEELKTQYDSVISEANKSGIDLAKECTATRDFLFEKRDFIKTTLLQHRNHLSVLKIAMVLSGDWFTGLSLDDKGNSYYERDGYRMVCKTAYVTEYI